MPEKRYPHLELGTYFTIQELSTILAALRYWQDHLAGRRPDWAMLEEIANDGGRCAWLSVAEIEALCERLNCVRDRA